MFQSLFCAHIQRLDQILCRRVLDLRWLFIAASVILIVDEIIRSVNYSELLKCLSMEESGK